MRYFLLGAVSAAAVACATPAYTSSSEGGEVVPATVADIGVAYGTTLPVSARLESMDRYVSMLEARIPATDPATNVNPLTRIETPLAPDAFADVTKEQFERMYMFSDGSDLKRIRMIPLAPATGTEEFYYNDGRLVYVYYEPDGATKPDPHPETSGDKYYFGTEGMIAWVKADGTHVDPSTDAFKSWAAQLSKEGERFARGLK